MSCQTFVAAYNAAKKIVTSNPLGYFLNKSTSKDGRRFPSIISSRSFMETQKEEFENSKPKREMCRNNDVWCQQLKKSFEDRGGGVKRVVWRAEELPKEKRS
jgi:hypothetical protein